MAVSMLVSGLSASADVDVKIADDTGVVAVKLNGSLFTEYHYKDAARPYFYPLIAPTGDNITRHWPMKQINSDDETDHPHQRSLWYTHGDVNGHDFWTEGRGPVIVQTRVDVTSGKDKGTILCENEWRAKDGKVICTDVRKHTITTSGESRIVDFEITIKASHGAVTLGDTKEGSMAFRVAPTLNLKGKTARGHIQNSEGVTDADAWGKRANWCDYYGPLNDKMVGITLMDHPDNPRHPTWWHARDYGLCAANPFGISVFEKKPAKTGDMEIKNGASVAFKYRVLVHKGSTENAGIEKEYQRYAKGE